MQAVRYHEYGGRDVLSVETVERPDGGPESVLVEVEAASVNPVDTYFREGAYESATLPWIPGADVAGTVVDTGADVESVGVGDRVFATALGREYPGTCAEYVAVPEDLLAPLPDGVDAAEAAAAALVGVTAWQTLVDACRLEPGQRALVHGGSGGVGHLAVQLAGTVGARVTTTAAPGYHDRLRELGADDLLDDRRDDLADAVVAAGRPDVVLDHRLDDYLALDATVAAQDAALAAIGNVSPSACFEDVARCRLKGLSVHHVSMYNTSDIGAVLARLAPLLADGELTAVVAREYGLDEVAEAHRAVLEDSYLGKLVVVP
jgi:NADPH2:quinone reductase